MDAKFRRHLTNARREITRAYERAEEVEREIGLRHGHKVEALRRIREVHEALNQLDEAIADE